MIFQRKKAAVWLYDMVGIGGKVLSSE